MGRGNKKKKGKPMIVGSDVDASETDSEHQEVPSMEKTGAAEVLEKAPTVVEHETEKKQDDPEPIKTVQSEVRHQPILVRYCPNCTFPSEYCEYSGMFEKCKPYLLRQAQEEEERARISAATEKGAKRKDPNAVLLNSGKGGKTRSQQVTITVKKRQGRKHVTLIAGLDLFGHQLKTLAMTFKKTFSSGCAVVSEDGHDIIELQGNMAELLPEMLCSKYDIPEDAISVVIKS